MKQKFTTSKRINNCLLLIIVFGGFLVFGFSENIKGPAIPRIQSDLTLNEMQVGLILSLNAFGYLLACSFTGVLTKKFGIRFSSSAAFITMAFSGVLIFLAKEYFSFSASYFVMYIGNGLLEIALAILAARIFTKNTGMMMNLSHFFYGLSSTIAPILATLLMGVKLSGNVLGWKGMYLAILSLSLLPLIPCIFAKFPGDEIKEEDRMSMKDYIKDPAAWLIVGVLSFGVISELSVGGWLVNFLEKAYKWDINVAAGMLSAFFFLFMLSRLILGTITDRVGFTKSIIIFSAFSGVCSLAAIIIGESGAFLFAIAGIGIAPIYPTVMAFLAKRYPKDSDTAISFTVTLMGIASVIGNFLVGAITDLFKGIFSNIYGIEDGLVKGLQAGYIFIALCAIICASIAFMLYRILKQNNQLI